MEGITLFGDCLSGGSAMEVKKLGVKTLLFERFAVINVVTAAPPTNVQMNG